MKAPSIQASLSRWMTFQIFVGLSIVCILIYAVTAWSFKVKQEEEFEQHTEVIKHLLAEVGAAQDWEGLRHKLDDFFISHADISVVLRQSGNTIYASEPSRSTARWIWKPVSLEDPRGSGGLIRLQLGVDAQGDAKLLGRLAWTLLGAAVVGTLLVSLTGSLLVGRGLRPLKKLAQQTASTGPEHPGRRIDPADYAVEIVPWVSQFNALLERVEQAYQQLESFNADVAHELRTPLANLIGTAEVELSRPRTAQELKEALISNLEEAQRLSAVVTDMLFLSKADRGTVARRSEPVSLADEVRAVAEFHEAALEAARLKVRISGDARAQIDVALVRRAISNLLSNAIRFAVPNSAIAVNVQEEADGVWVKVANRGETIPVEALPHLFKRFFRVERSRAGSNENHGLGLAIVAAIARMHGGETRASSRSGATEIGFSLLPANYEAYS